MKDKHQILFDLIARYYGLYFEYQKKKYSIMLDKVSGELDFVRNQNIIDFGCGTGALCSALHHRGLKVTGVDASSKMLKVAAEKTNGETMNFVKADILAGVPFDDKNFDVSFASLVMHGLKPRDRQKLYREMQRVTRNLIIIYDYNQKRSLQADLLESLEGGDYFGFIKNVKEELYGFFGNLQVIDQGDQYACYIVRLS